MCTLIVSYNDSIKSMLRWLLRTPRFLARQSKKTRQNPLPQPTHEEEVEEKGRSFQSEYYRFKDNYLKLDEIEKEDPKEAEQLDLTMKLIKQMMKNQGGDQDQPLMKKQKVDVREKLKKMGTPDSFLNQDQTQQQQMLLHNPKKQGEFSSSSLDKQAQLHEDKLMFEKFDQKIAQDKQLTPEQYQKMKEQELKLAQQDLILNQILQSTKQKEMIHINRVQDQPDALGMTEKEKKLIMRQQKIMEALQNKEDPSQKKYNITRQDLISMKYSSQIIQKAKQYKNQEFAYLKDLILGENEDTSLSSVHRRRFLNEQEEKRWNLLTQKMPDKSLPENTYETARTQEGLVQYEDTEFYKKKALKQLKEKGEINEEDRLIIQEFNKDLGLGNEISEVFLDNVVFKEDGKIDRAIAMQDTSFGKQKKQIRNLTERLDKLGLDYQFEDIQQMSKISLFQQKKFLEEQQRLQKYLHQKEKKKNMKKELREIHRSKLRDDLDFSKQEQKVMTIKQIKESNNLSQLQDNYEKVNQYMEQKASTTVNETQDEKMSRIHHKKTFKNMNNVISMYFANGIFNHNVGQLDKVAFREVIPNRTNTVLNVFWDIEGKYLEEKGIVQGSDNYQVRFEEVKKNMEEKLKRQAPYISGKMTQFLKLRYGPQIRFHYDRKTKQTADAVEELGKYVKEIAMEEMQDYIKKGYITSEQKEVEYFEKLLVVAKTKLQDFNSRKQLLSKKFVKFEKRKDDLIERQLKKNKDKQLRAEQAKIEAIKKNKKISHLYGDQDDELIIPGEEKKVERKKRPADRFWDSIDML